MKSILKNILSYIKSLLNSRQNKKTSISVKIDKLEINVYKTM